MNTFKCNKPDHFIAEYESLFKDKQPKRLLEIGIQTGNSLRMWADYFPDTEIVGLDIVRPNVPMPNNVKMVEGDQTNRELLESLGEFDIIIDDGGHTCFQQQTSFEILFPRLKKGGVYVVEDVETSHMAEFMDTERTTMEYFQALLNVHKVSNKLEFVFEQSIKRLSFIKDMIVIEKL
jgi:cephalosporin hydroxylase